MKVGLKQLRNMQKPPVQQSRRPPRVFFIFSEHSQEWDNRFHIQKMPEYNPLEDEHCRIYSDSLKRYGKSAAKGKPHAVLAPGGLRVIKAQPSIERPNDNSLMSIFINLPSKISKDGEKKLKSNKSKENISPKKNIPGTVKKKIGPTLVNPDTISSLHEEITYLWEIYRIEKVYQNAFMESLQYLQPKMYIQILAKEIENLYNEKSMVQQLFLSIQKREDAIKTIKQLLTYIQTNPNVPDIKDEVNFRAK